MLTILCLFFFSIRKMRRFYAIKFVDSRETQQHQLTLVLISLVLVCQYGKRSFFYPKSVQSLRRSLHTESVCVKRTHSARTFRCGADQYFTCKALLCCLLLLHFRHATDATFWQPFHRGAELCRSCAWIQIQSSTATGFVIVSCPGSKGQAQSHNGWMLCELRLIFAMQIPSPLPQDKLTFPAHRSRR